MYNLWRFAVKCSYARRVKLNRMRGNESRCIVRPSMGDEGKEEIVEVLTPIIK